MSSKAKTRGPSAQRTATATSSSSATSTPQVPTSTSSVQSPMTPTRLSRIQEKNTLANLNDRLAAYIERNQQLEYENQTFTKQISQYEENMSKTVNRVKGEYEKEVTSLRKLVDETAKDKNKLEHDFGALKKDFDDIKSKFDRKTKDFNTVQKSLAQTEETLAQLQANFSRASAERDQLLSAKKDFESDINKLTREVADLRNKLEKESLARVEAENQLRHKTEELQFKNQLHQQEVTEIRTRRQVEIQEVDGRLQQEYEAKLQQSIQELREEYDAQILANKEETENIYEQKYADLKNQVKRTQGSLASKVEEIATLQAKLEASTLSSSKFEQERNDLLRKIKDLEKKSDDDHARFAKLLDARDSDIETLVRDKNTLMTEYKDLMDTKVALDNEIATYRKLLECEEKRLSISPRFVKGKMTPAAERGTPLRAKKRRYEEESYDDESNFQVDSNHHGDVIIDDDDVEGKFVKLRNRGDKEVSLSGWTLTRRAGDLETTHKFHRQMKLEPGAVVTVWSSDIEGATHDPPHNVIVKGQKWFPSVNLHTVLHNNSNEQMSERKTTRRQVSHERKRLGFGPSEDLFHQEGEIAQGERCVIC